MGENTNDSNDKQKDTPNPLILLIMKSDSVNNENRKDASLLVELMDDSKNTSNKVMDAGSYKPPTAPAETTQIIVDAPIKIKPVPKVVSKNREEVLRLVTNDEEKKEVETKKITPKMKG